MLRPSLTLLALLLGTGALAQKAAQDAPVTEGVPKQTPPTVKKKVAAPYPEGESARVKVTLELDLDEQGHVTHVEVKQSGGEKFDRAAIAAVSQWEFEPARTDGSPIPSQVMLDLTFTPPKIVRKEVPPPPVTPGALTGIVLLRGSRSPVAGGRVILVLGDRSYMGEIGDDGHFRVEAPPGKYHVIANGPKAKRFETDETLEPGETVTVKYWIEPNQYTKYEAIVRGDVNREEISRQTLSREELAKMPGTMGDALRAIENLPGVARAPFNSGLIIIRGGRPTDSKVYIGASEVPQLYHFGGLTSVVPTAVISQVDYFPGNFGVRYGRAIAGTVDVDLREGQRDRWHGALETNVFDTGFMVEGPVGKGSILLGARRSYVDALLQAFSTPGLKFTSAPVYYDYQGIFDYPLWGGKLKLMVLGSDDVLKLVFGQPADADPALTAFGTHILFHKLQLRWTRTVGKWNLFAQLTGGYSAQSGQLGRALDYDVGNGTVDARLEARYAMSKSLSWLFGADIVYANVALALDVPPPTREGQTPSPISANQIQHLHQPIDIGEVGLYVEAKWKPSSRITITPGLRFDWYSPLPHPSFNPRLQARFDVARFTSIKAGLGLYSQSPQPTDYVAQFGNPRMRPESAVHAALTLEQGIAPGLIGEATGFYKHLYDLSAPSSAFVLRDGQVSPEHVASIGEGRVYGLELLLRQSVSKWFFGWISYTLMKSERKDCPACGWRLFDFDQTHILVVALHAYLPRGFEIGARFRYITGRPQTQGYGGYYDADSDVYTPAAGPVNTTRLADYHTLDIRVDKTFLFKRWMLKIYLDITNVYNRANQEMLQPAYDYTRMGPITGLPIIPSFGIRGEF